MNEPKDNCHKHWAQGKKPSMKRRSEENNYLDRGIYLVTLAIERRQPLLGTLAGRADITEGTQAPHVMLTPFGGKGKTGVGGYSSILSADRGHEALYHA
jgi:hypothetical protein